MHVYLMCLTSTISKQQLMSAMKRDKDVSYNKFIL